MKRWQELEQAVTLLLKAKKIKFIKIDNYRCYKCGTIQNSKAKGWPDFFCYEFKNIPFLLAIECKTGSGKVAPGQRSTLESLERAGVQTIVLRDTVDELLRLLNKY